MYPENLKYSETHEWIKVEGKIITLGITFHAKEQLTMHGAFGFTYVGKNVIERPDKTRCIPPEIGSAVRQGEEFEIIESAKVTAGIISPVEGKIAAVNEKLTYVDNLNLIYEDPYGEGWLVKMETENFDPSALMDAQAYQKFLEENNE
jgi:glycine cleavage system H protein